MLQEKMKRIKRKKSRHWIQQRKKVLLRKIRRRRNPKRIKPLIPTPPKKRRMIPPLPTEKKMKKQKSNDFLFKNIKKTKFNGFVFFYEYNLTLSIIQQPINIEPCMNHHNSKLHNCSWKTVPCLKANHWGKQVLPQGKSASIPV